MSKKIRPRSIQFLNTSYIFWEYCEEIKPTPINCSCCRCGRNDIECNSVIYRDYFEIRAKGKGTKLPICNDCLKLLTIYSRIEINSDFFTTFPCVVISPFDTFDESTIYPSFSFPKHCKKEIIKIWNSHKTIEEEFPSTQGRNRNIDDKTNSYYPLTVWEGPAYSQRNKLITEIYHFITHSDLYIKKFKLNKAIRRKNQEKYLIKECFAHASRQNNIYKLAEIILYSSSLTIYSSDFNNHTYSFYFGLNNKYLALAVIAGYFTSSLLNKRESLKNRDSNILNIFSEFGITLI